MEVLIKEIINFIIFLLFLIEKIFEDNVILRNNKENKGDNKKLLKEFL